MRPEATSTSCTIDSSRIPEGGRPAGRREVGRERQVDGDQRGAALGEQELVEVGGVAVARADARDLAVAGAHDHAVALTVAAVDAALPPGEHGRAPVALDAEVRRRPLGQRPEPDRLAAVVDDQRPALARPRDGGDQQPARGRTAGGRHRERGRLQIRPRPERPHVRVGGREPSGRGSRPRRQHGGGRRTAQCQELAPRPGPHGATQPHQSKEGLKMLPASAQLLRHRALSAFRGCEAMTILADGRVLTTPRFPARRAAASPRS